MNQTPLILLVDDDASIRKLCDRMLKRIGFDLLGAENGRKARKLVKDHGETACAVLLDVNLPDILGGELVKEFSAMHPSLPVIYFTGSVTTEESVRQDGFIRYYLKKPFTKADLIGVLEKSGVAVPAA